jgi:hypothetical protein
MPEPDVEVDPPFLVYEGGTLHSPPCKGQMVLPFEEFEIVCLCGKSHLEGIHSRMFCSVVTIPSG